MVVTKFTKRLNIDAIRAGIAGNGSKIHSDLCKIFKKTSPVAKKELHVKSFNQSGKNWGKRKMVLN